MWKVTNGETKEKRIKMNINFQRQPWVTKIHSVRVSAKNKNKTKQNQKTFLSNKFLYICLFHVFFRCKYIFVDISCNICLADANEDLVEFSTFSSRPSKSQRGSRRRGRLFSHRQTTDLFTNSLYCFCRSLYPAIQIRILRTRMIFEDDILPSMIWNFFKKIKASMLLSFTNLSNCSDVITKWWHHSSTLWELRTDMALVYDPGFSTI